jgi:alkylation response protein AidB-like acyl-CoA dehydrogenase
VEGGYLVSGRKAFASQAPVGSVLSTMARYEDPVAGPTSLSFSVPFSAPELEVVETWDSLGMRGTASHDVNLNGFFVPEDSISARRPIGKVDGGLCVIAANAMAVITGAYLGVARRARDEATRSVPEARSADPVVQRQVGLLEAEWREALWAFDRLLAELADDPAPVIDTFVLTMLAKRAIAEHGQRVVDLALDLAGGRAYAHRGPIERAYRDFRAIRFHPLTPELTLRNAGQFVLGLPADEA